MHGNIVLNNLESLISFDHFCDAHTLFSVYTCATCTNFKISFLAPRLGRQLCRHRPRLAPLHVPLKMASTETQPSAKPISEKQRAKLEKLANKKEKEAQQALQKLQQGGSKEKKAKKQNAEPTIDPKDWVEETPAGQTKILKSLDGDFHKAYYPNVVESAWYSFWENQGHFKPRTEEDGSLKPKGKYVIAIPPPNVRDL